MPQGSWAAVEDIVADAAGAGRVAPAVSLLVGRGRDVLFECSAGSAGAPGRERACDAGTVFDLASLTKPLVTVALVLDLVSQRRLELDAAVGDLLPAFAEGKDGRRGRVTVRDLLRHDSGLPAYRKYFEGFEATRPSSAVEAQQRRARMLGFAAAEPLERDPRSGNVYSDVGFLVLGALVEGVAGRRIDELFAERIAGPLGVEEVWYADLARRSTPDWADRAAATGDCAWRGHAVHAAVQDENAWAMGGVASHAGLFATTRAVHRLVAAWTDAASGRAGILEPRLVQHAWNREAAAAGAAAADPASTWALGWDTPSPGGSSAGSRIGADAVGHLGYTGTSIWVDPSRGVHVVLL